MSTSITPVQSDLYKALGDFIASVLSLSPPNIVVGLDNRVPTPTQGYVAMTILLAARLATTVDDWDKTDPAPTVETYRMSTRYDVQVDCFGPAAQEWAMTLATLLRDEYGCTALGPNCQPLWADDARQIPFITAEDQYQQRWSLTVALQYNPTVTVTSQFADAAHVTVLNVDETYPP